VARTRTAPAPRPVCAPDGDMTPWPTERYRCTDNACTAILRHARAGRTLNDWTDVDENGEHTRYDGPPLLRIDPKAWWDKLTADMLAGDDRAGNLYALMTMGGDFTGRRWVHIHRCGERIDPRPDRDGPTCCKQPMWASPDGWACRVSGQVFPAT
jgi:hypothetical protein